MIQKQNSFYSINRKALRESVRNKLKHGSFHTRSLREKSACQAINYLGIRNRKMVSNQHRVIPIYLIYKNQKFIIESYQGMAYSQLVPLLYKQILKYELVLSQKSREENQKVLKAVLGFSTANQDLNTDYLMSIMKGKVQRSLMLQCFVNKNQKISGINLKKFANQDNLNTNMSNSNCQKNSDNCSRFDYQIYNCLAIGGFSKVYLARSYEDGKFYVIKFIRRRTDREEQLNRQSIINEMKISALFDHPFIIQMREGFQTSKFFGMVFEYCPGGELFYLLKKVKTMSEENARFYFIQILLAIKHIHQKNIVYRDLKPENILVDWKGNLKIVDFGLSKEMGVGRDKTFSYCGSAQYMAPEMILRLGHNASIDYYSLGALLYELVTGLPPFYTKNQRELQQCIIHEQLSFPSHTPLSAELKDFLCHLLEKDQKHRLGSYAGIKQVMFHPWVGKFKSDQYLQKHNENVPYPPNLSEHNFDVNQLGGDERQFTMEIKKYFNCKNALKYIEYHTQIDKKSCNSPYIQIIEKILEENQLAIKTNIASIKQTKFNKMNISRVKKMHQKLSVRKQNALSLISLHQSEDVQRKIKNYSPLVLFKSVRDTTAQNVRSDSIENNENEHRWNEQVGDKQKRYYKLYPYFCNAQNYKPKNVLKDAKKILPRGNILKLKAVTNLMKESSNH